LSFERTHGSAEDLEAVQKQMPRKTKRRRKLDDDSWEEYIDYVFPADDKQAANLSNLLSMAQSWKQQSGGGLGA
jgi:crooked neck